MEKLDRLGWVAGFAVDWFGLKMGVRVTDERCLAPARLAIGGVETDPDVDVLFSIVVGAPAQRRGVRNFHLLYSAASRIARTLDLDELFAALRATRESYAGLAPEVAVVAGARIEAPDGPRVVLSQDQPEAQILIARDGRARAYPTADEPVPVRSLAVVELDGQEPAACTRLSPAQACFALMTRAPHLRWHPGRISAVLRSFAGHVPAVRIRSSNADSAERLLHGMFFVP